ncbi:MAG: hypothetical protein IJY85_00175 [Ruminococcus sp.]|nr:hypothetical protein [Ruminococcus sp.]
MRKLFATLLSLFLITALCSCNSTKDESNVETTKPIETTTTVQSAELSEAALREKYPEYFEMDHFKGIEVYVWKMGENSYRCGALPGTNRNKAYEEILALVEHSVSVDEMKMIMQYSDVPQEDYFIIPCVQPISSYYYEIDDALREEINQLF